jgi:hypothetical protein
MRPVVLLDFDLKPGDRQNEGLSELQSDRTGRAAEAGARGAGGRVLAVLLILCFRSPLFPRTHPVPAIKRSGSRPRARGAAGAAAGPREIPECAHTVSDSHLTALRT